MSPQVVPVNPASQTVVVHPPAEQVAVPQADDDVVVGRSSGPQGPPGEPGTPGPVGPQGPRGFSGEGGYFVHNQATPASVWVIDHQLGYVPAYTVVDSAGSVVEGDVLSFDNLVLTLSFSGAFSGTAYLS